MLNIPPELLTRYVAFLEKRAVPSSQYNDYKKWLRYYLDHCNKYGFWDEGSKSLSQFLAKLKEKKHTEVQIRRAGHSVTLYHDLKRLSKQTPPLIREGKNRYEVKEEKRPDLPSPKTYESPINKSEKWSISGIKAPCDSALTVM